jgi:hypothetical protein
MLSHCLTGRLCGPRRQRSVALRFAVLFGGALVSWISAKAAEAPAKIGLELNRLEDQAGSCRAYLVISNPGSSDFSGFALDLVVFDRGGTIMRRLAVDVAPVRPAKTSVKVFDIPETTCGAIGSILVNDVIHCRDPSGDVAECIDRLSTSSKLSVSLMK